MAIHTLVEASSRRDSGKLYFRIRLLKALAVSAQKRIHLLPEFTISKILASARDAEARVKRPKCKSAGLKLPREAPRGRGTTSRRSTARTKAARRRRGRGRRHPGRSTARRGRRGCPRRTGRPARAASPCPTSDAD